MVAPLRFVLQVNGVGAEKNSNAIFNVIKCIAVM